MRRNYPDIQFERYADDVICHCSSQRDAQALKKSLEARFSTCHLTLQLGQEETGLLQP
jgi:superfamily II DNA/RNA helicase